MKPALGLAVLLVAAGLVVSRPLAREWRDAVPLTARPPADTAVLTRAPGDTLQLYYQLWLVEDGLRGATPLFRDPYQFRVDGPRWNLPQSFLPLALPFALLGVLGGLAAYNLLVLLSFPASGVAAYGLVRHLTGHAAAAVVAGAAYAVVPARLGPLFGGQPAGFAAAMVPLVLWGLDVALTTGRLWGALLGGGALVALAMLEPHYTYLAAGLAAAAGLVRSLASRPRLRPTPLLVSLALAGLAAGWLLMLRQLFLLGSIAEAGRTLDEVRLFSPGPGALRLPATYGGVTLLALALVGLVVPGPRRRLVALFYGVVLAAGLVLSLGPTVPGLPLYRLLHRGLPLFGLIRNPEKFRLLTSVGAVVLAGLGTRALLGALPPRVARPAGWALLGLVLVETAPWHPIAVTRLPDSPLYPSIRAEARRVLYLPVWPGDSAWSSLYLYHVTRTRVPMINGYSPLVPGPYPAGIFGPLQGLNVGDLGPAEHARLGALGITHLVVDRAVFPPQASPFPSAFTRDRLRAAPGLQPEGGVDPLWLFRVTDRVERDQPRASSPVGLFFEAEALSREVGVVADDPAASGGRVVVAHPGAARPGFLMFGPYRLLPAAAYQATFRVRGGGLTAEVTADRGRRVLATVSVAAGAEWHDVELPFTIARAEPVEYRLRWTGTAEAAADWVAVAFADRPQPEWGFEVEALPHLVGERADPAASGGVAGYADPVASRRIALVSGPSRLYPAGRYRIALRARAAASGVGPLLLLTVTEPGGRTLASRTVTAPELPLDRYGAVGLDFVLTRATVVEFPVVYLGSVGVYFDRLDVEPRAP